jgi:hypothetical protein
MPGAAIPPEPQRRRGPLALETEVVGRGSPARSRCGANSLRAPYGNAQAD